MWYKVYKIPVWISLPLPFLTENLIFWKVNLIKVSLIYNKQHILKVKRFAKFWHGYSFVNPSLLPNIPMKKQSQKSPAAQIGAQVYLKPRSISRFRSLHSSWENNQRLILIVWGKYAISVTHLFNERIVLKYPKIFYSFICILHSISYEEVVNLWSSIF